MPRLPQILDVSDSLFGGGGEHCANLGRQERRTPPQRSFSLQQLAWLACGLWITLLLQTGHAYQPPRPNIPDRLPIILEDGSIKPDAIYLRDQLGNPIYVPRQRYEEFEQYQREKLAQATIKTPDYLLEQVQGELAVEGEIARCSWIFRLKPLNPSIPVLRIDLGLKEQNTVGSAQISGGQVNALRPITTGGYEWWIQVDGSPNYEIRFQTTAKVVRESNGQSLKLDLPNSPTELQWKHSLDGQQVSVLGGGSATIEPEEREGVRYSKIRSAGGRQVLVWRSPSVDSIQEALEAESTTRLTISNPSPLAIGSTRIQFKPTRRKAVREVTLVLPEGMSWVPQRTSLDANISIEPARERPVEPASGSETPASLNGKALLIRIEDSSADKNELVVNWEWNFPGADTAWLFRGPRLLEVQRHTGTLSVETSEDQFFRWNSTPQLILFQQEGFGETSRQQRTTFRFPNQEYELSARLLIKEPSLRLSPRYWVRVSSDRALLTGMIEIDDDVLRTIDLNWQLQAWQLTRVQCDDQDVESDQKREENAWSLTEWLSRVQETAVGNSRSRTHRFQIEAERVLTPDDLADLAFLLPQFTYSMQNATRIADQGTGLFAMSFASDLSIDETALRLSGLLQDAGPSQRLTDWIPQPQETELTLYRFQSDSTPAEWRSKLIRHHQRCLLRHQFHWQIEQEQVIQKQTFDCETLYQPLQKLHAQIPRRWLEAMSLGQGQLEFRLQGSQVNWLPVSPLESESDPEWQVVELVSRELPSRFRLECEWRNAIDWEEPQASTNLELTLLTPVWPASSELLEQRGALDMASGLEIGVSEGAATRWQGVGSHREVQIEGLSNSFQLPLLRLQTTAPPPNSIDRILIQTALSTSQLRHRTVVRMTTSQPYIEFSIPDVVEREGLKVLLDGMSVPTFSHDDIYRIELPLGGNRTHVCEFWIWEKRRSQWPESLQARMPNFKGTSTLGPVLWYVELPPGECVIGNPSSMIPAFQWMPTWFGWQRKPSQSSDELVRWAGGTEQPPVATGVQPILFLQSDSQDLQLHIVKRMWIWIVGLLAWMMAYWLVIRVPVGWRPAIGISLALGTLVLVGYSLDLASALLQLLALTCMTLLVKHGWTWLRQRPTTIYRRTRVNLPPSGSQASIASTHAMDSVGSASAEVTP